MLQRLSVKHHRAAVSLVSAALLGVTLSGCMSGAERRQVNLQADASTCESYGASYGTPAYTACMLEQQQRRDFKHRDSLERTRMTTDIARDSQIMADRARKERCDRDPDRRECRR
ncbi:hypothetical protein RAN3_4118 [plant metagenome]|uniref:Lipoprotein n=1 Tax=plant metagenome TaxID=1297885 RepID=A0A484UYS7_9ZZZZ